MDRPVRWHTGAAECSRCKAIPKRPDLKVGGKVPEVSNVAPHACRQVHTLDSLSYVGYWVPAGGWLGVGGRGVGYGSKRRTLLFTFICECLQEHLAV